VRKTLATSLFIYTIDIYHFRRLSQPFRQCALLAGFFKQARALAFPFESVIFDSIFDVGAGLIR
ncbi:MAG TPA: hypothetical protein VMH37_08820, partial [Candidatus Binataceae bacterium]|nr:hypothetical protein [Candidatus Binataceae bacterium]